MQLDFGRALPVTAITPCPFAGIKPTGTEQAPKTFACKSKNAFRQNWYIYGSIYKSIYSTWQIRFNLPPLQSFLGNILAGNVIGLGFSIVSSMQNRRYVANQQKFHCANWDGRFREGSGKNGENVVCYRKNNPPQ